jgi:hypothetical protein
MTEVEDLRRDFKTSRRFGIVGVVVVMVVVAALALAFGSNNAHPTVLMAVILAIVFGFVAVLMILQRRDLTGAEARSARAAVEVAGPVTDPTTADANALLHALAIKPVDDAAIAESTSRIWSITRGSMNSGAILMVLIACAVIPWQLFTAYWSIYIFVPIIVAYVGWLAARVIMPGGTLDQAYDSSAPMLGALGLEQVERPEIRIQPRVAGPGLQKRVRGEIEYAGARHGRQVTVRIPADGGPTRTTLGGTFEELRVAAKGERLVARRGAPTAVNAVLDPLPRSSYWNGVSVSAGPDGLVVERKRDGGQHWLRDLWLAEHLADALSSRA